MTEEMIEEHLPNTREVLVDAKKTTRKIADTLYLQAPVSNGTILFLVLLFFFVFKNYSDSYFHFLWSVVMICSVTYRLYLWHRRSPSTIGHKSDSYWINQYSFASMIVGFSWGSIFFLPFISQDLILYSLLLMVFFGVLTAAVPVLSVSLRAYFSYTLPVLSCFIIAIYMLNKSISFYIIIGVAAYYIMLSLLARNSNKQIIHSINLQFQNETLIDQLRQEVVERESLIKNRTKQLEQSYQQIQDSENRLKNVISAAELGYWDWDYQTGRQVVNNRWLDMLGLSRGDIENNVTDWDMRVHPDDKARMTAIVENAIKENIPYVADFRMKHKDGYWVWIQGAGSVIESDNFTHEPLRLCGTYQDISYRKNMEKELEERAKRDYLTGLFNRVELEKEFQNEYLRSKRYHHELSVFLIDIDHFKLVNDTYGHLAGDKILKKYAAFLQNTIRETDLVARYGGEEFVVILPETSLKEARELAERLLINTNNLNIKFEDKTFKITISLGIAMYPDHGDSYEVLLEHADMAMYSAKQNGRNRVCTWDQ